MVSPQSLKLPTFLPLKQALHRGHPAVKLSSGLNPFVALSTAWNKLENCFCSKTMRAGALSSEVVLGNTQFCQCLSQQQLEFSVPAAMLIFVLCQEVTCRDCVGFLSFSQLLSRGVLKYFILLSVLMDTETQEM